MAISTSPFLMGLSGSVGSEITFKNYNGKIVVCKKIGKRKKKATPQQEANQLNFKDANTVAKKIYQDPVQREEARLRLKVPHGNELYRAILKEYLSGEL